MGDYKRHLTKIKKITGSKSTADTAVSGMVTSTAGTPSARRVVKLVALAVVMIAVVAGIVLVSLRQVSKTANVAFTIDGKSYSKALVDVLAHIQSDQNDAQTPKQAAVALFGYLKEQQASQAIGIAPDHGQIEVELKALSPSLLDYALSKEQTTALKQAAADKTFAKVSLPTGPTSSPYVNEWAYILAYHNALAASYSNAADGKYQGYSFVFDFSDKIIPPVIDEPKVAGYGDQGRIAADQAHAKQEAMRYHDMLTAGTMTSVQLLAATKKDFRLGTTDKNISFSTLDSDLFDSSVDPSIESHVHNQNIADFIKKQTKTGVSDVQVAKVPKVRSPKNPGDYADGIYYFVSLDGVTKAVPKAQQQLQEKLKTIKASYNGI
jgi:hypothetical protein